MRIMVMVMTMIEEGRERGSICGVSRENSRHFLNDNNKYVRERERIRKNNAILSENAKER
jgi:hypothetical protein|tara:strand:+ start:892 stop:1071 length:180 start_codon:yes stop_codon:yes gene_type:complete